MSNYYTACWMWMQRIKNGIVTVNRVSSSVATRKIRIVRKTNVDVFLFVFLAIMSVRGHISCGLSQSHSFYLFTRSFRVSSFISRHIYSSFLLRCSCVSFFLFGFLTIFGFYIFHSLVIFLVSFHHIQYSQQSQKCLFVVYWIGCLQYFSWERQKER